MVTSMINLLLIITLPSFISSLSFNTPPSPTTTVGATAAKISSPVVQKVAIIGAGISGLSLMHAFENSVTCSKVYQDEVKNKNISNYPLESIVFESRKSLDYNVGAGIQLTGGMSVLHRINPDLQKAVARASLPLTTIRSRTKPGGIIPKDSLSSQFSSLFEMNLKQSIQQAGGSVEQNLIIDGEVMAYCIMRGSLQKTLYDHLPHNCKQRVKFGKTLTNLYSCDSNLSSSKGGIMCQFADGTEEGPFDLVVGCDGINSVVKEYVETGNVMSRKGSQQATEKLRASLYSGIRIQYAVQTQQPDGGNENSEQKPDKLNLTLVSSAELCQYFGDGAYGLAGVYGTGEGRLPTKAAFLIFRDENYVGPFKKRQRIVNDSSSYVNENADWKQENESVGALMAKRIQQANVPNEQIGPIVRGADKFFELGVYFHNPLTFNGWSREVKGSNGRYCVLSGDAAHAMPPFLGQGSNQAIQDSYTLAKKVFEYNTNVLKALPNSENNNSLRNFLKEYEDIRWKATTSITAKSAFLGYLETGGQGFQSAVRDAFFYTAGKIGIARNVFLDAATPRIAED